MDKFQILFKGKPKNISGVKVGNYFGVDLRLGKGWMINHLPSGLLLTDAVFATDKDAIYFAEICEKTFGDALASPSQSVLIDNRYDVPGGDAFYTLRTRIEDLDGVINREAIDEQIGLIRNEQAKNRHSKKPVSERPA